ncbi:hemerythrin HHE cation binding protein [Methanolobus psychrophilus R15]|nr:hemerythrin HHE cation binding protein [Methanolobus psychrophilus R15]
MLKIMDGMCTKIESRKEIEHEHLENVVEFLKVFVDKCHHTKEEEHLFPIMRRANVPGSTEIIDSLLEEHEHGRRDVDTIAKAVSANMDSEALSTVVKSSRDYIELLTQHINKEDNILFPLADKHLAGKVQEEMQKSFQIVEIEKIGEGKHEEFHKMLHNLKDIHVIN